MDNADMPSGSDNSNNPDDLIAELARLMAADAKGEPEAEAPTQHQVPAAPPAPAPPAAAPPAPAPPAAEPTAPAPVAAEPEAPAPVAAEPEAPRPDPIPRLVPEAQSEPQRPAPSFVSPQSAAAPQPAPTPDPAPVIPPARPARNDDALSPVGRAQQLANARQSAENSLGATSDPVPPSQARANSVNEQFGYSVQPAPTSGEPDASQRFTPPQSADPIIPPSQRSNVADDPIGALISAQLETDTPEEFSEPPMAPSQPAQTKAEMAQNDTFSAAPAFGNDAHNTPPSQETGKRDPLDDIESLIGAALKTDPQPQVQAQAHAPASHAQNVPHAAPAPAPAQAGEVDGAANAAEAAILAATQSMQPQNGAAPQVATQGSFAPQFVEPDLGGAGTQTGSRPSRTMPKTGGNWQRIAGPLVAAALLVAVGLGLFWVFGTGSDPDGNAPVLSADTSPTRETPEAAIDTADAAGSVVLSENDGQAETIERLISRDDTLDAAGNEVSRIITPNETEDLALANRKVRTVTVRPDGTIVSGEQSVAGGEQLPVDRPNVPELSAADTPTAVAANPTTTSEPVAQIIETATTFAGAAPPIPLPRPTNRASTPTIAVAQPTPTFSATPTSNNTNAVDLVANTGQQAVTQTQTPAVQQAVLTGGTNAPAYVQLSSQRDLDAANRSLATVRSQFATQLGGGTLEVQEVNLGERGTFYRVRLPSQSIDAANGVCASIKSAGGDCFVRTN